LSLTVVFTPFATALGEDVDVDEGDNSTFTVPRTHFGHPDLQGIWTNATLTTLERPDDFDALNLSPEEAEKLLSARQARWQEYEDAARDEDGKLSAGADVGGYNTFWMDEGNSLAMVDGQYRSSRMVPYLIPGLGVGIC